jgi:hypothetical protein
VPDHIRHAQCRAVEPRGQAQGVEVRFEDEVPVALLPADHRVPVDRVQVDVDGQEVVAALRLMLGDVREEERTCEPLTLQAALHVGQAEHGVHPAARDGLAQLLQPHALATSSLSRLRTGPLNHRRAESSHQPPTTTITTPTVMGA